MEEIGHLTAGRISITLLSYLENRDITPDNKLDYAFIMTCSLIKCSIVVI